jgi:type I restriction enzyme S subunit
MELMTKQGSAVSMPKGFKQTEIGLIPEDWEVLEVSDVFDFSGGSQPPRSTFIFNEKKGYIRLLQIRDYKSDKYQTYIPENLAQKKCCKDDIMIGRYGPPIFQILKGHEGAYNVALIKAIPKNINKLYGYYFLTQNVLFEFVEKLSQRSSGQTGVDLKQLKQYKFSLPPTLNEQKAIATALSDVDDLISSLDKLLEKKKAIKQGAMQQLLTGKKRLPGFTGEWVERKLGEVAEFRRGSFPQPYGLSKWYDEQSGIPFIQVVDVGKNLRLKPDTKQHISELAKRLSVLIPERSVIVTLQGSIGRVAITHYEAYMDRTLLVFTKFREAVAKHFFALQLEQLFKLEAKRAPGGIIKTITKDKLKDFVIKLPYLQEQQAIAKILSDMDTEITQLESKKSKYQSLKQGMMQELLTGKTRLI